VTQVRFTESATNEIDALYFYVPYGNEEPRDRIIELARRVRQLWPSLLLSIVGNGGAELWGSDWTERLAPFGLSLARHWSVSAELVGDL
jgi:hypothetical protein